jgi:hypothetical protein
MLAKEPRNRREHIRVSPHFLHRRLLFPKHAPFFIREGLRQTLAGELPKTLQNEIRHKIPRIKYFLMEPERRIIIYIIEEELDGINGAYPVFCAYRPYGFLPVVP